MQPVRLQYTIDYILQVEWLPPGWGTGMPAGHAPPAAPPAAAASAAALQAFIQPWRINAHQLRHDVKPAENSLSLLRSLVPAAGLAGWSVGCGRSCWGCAAGSLPQPIMCPLYMGSNIA